MIFLFSSIIAFLLTLPQLFKKDEKGKSVGAVRNIAEASLIILSFVMMVFLDVSFVIIFVLLLLFTFLFFVIIAKYDFSI